MNAVSFDSLRFPAFICTLMLLAGPATAQSSTTDLEAIIRAGSVEQLKLYLAEPGVDINGRSAQDTSLLDIAAQFDRIDAATYLLDHGAQVDGRKKSWPNTGITALHVAAYFGGVQVEQLLLDRGAGVDALSKVGATPLMYAARAGQLGAARLLIDNGARLDLTTSREQTAMQEAILGEHLEMARYLESRGAEVSGGLLGQAALNGDAKSVRFVLQHHVDANDLNSGLNFALLGNPERVLERKQILSDLLTQGADIDHLTYGLPPMATAPTADMVEFLFQHGANVKVHTPDTLLVRGVACHHRDHDQELVHIFKVLRSHGVELRDDKEAGETALECVRRFGLTESTRYLLVVETSD
jgi:ankyrin